MASLKFYPVVTGTTTSTITTLATGNVAVGKRQIVRVVGDGDCYLTFTIGTGTASATSMYLPAKTVEYFDMSDQADTVNIYNGTGASIHVSVSLVSKS